MEKIQADFSGNEKKVSSIKRNKFIYIIIFLILLIIGYSTYLSVFKEKIDRSSYVQLVSGEATLNDIPLYVNAREQLSINDLIKTTTEESLAIIEWGDGSITRLGGNTSLVIDELDISDNKDNLNIAFELLSGKTWSNVVSYIPEESFFKQTFKDSEVAVRGTIFNVDTLNDYLYVIDHKVSLKDSEGNIIEIGEKEPLELSTLESIDLVTFIRSFKDSTFEKLNTQLDEGLIQDLKDDIQAKLGSLIDLASIDTEGLSEEEKQNLYTQLLEGYQEINFIGSADGQDLFDLKLALKESLLAVSPDTEKEALLDSFMYDFKDSLSNQNYSGLNQILIIFNENKEYLDLDIMEEINSYLTKLNLKDGIEESILKNLTTFKDSFLDSGDFSNVTNIVETNIDTVINKAGETKDSIKSNIKTFILNLFN